jgi:dihydroorotate dehydrogenase (fumarate)
MEKIDKIIKIGDILFEYPVLNASGCWCINEKQIIKLYNSKLGGVVTKTCTITQKTGNPMPNYYYDYKNNIHFNSKGLPNFGYNYYKNVIANYNEYKKPIILSVAYENLEDIRLILTDYENFANKNVLVEINVSCPNVNSRIYGYHKKDIIKLLDFLSSLKLKFIKIGLKLPPYFEIEFITKLSKILNNCTSFLKFIVVSNSIPNAVILNDNTHEPILSNKYGGMSGKLNKHISLSNVMTFTKTLSKEIKIIGCGGIETIEDILEYFKCGASFVQLGSCFYYQTLNELNISKINDLILNNENELISKCCI